MAMSVGPNNLALGGSYQTIVSMRKGDVLALFVECYKNETFSAVVKVLAAAM